MQEKLKPCPFCDEKIEVATQQWASNLKWYVECLICGSAGSSKATEEKAIEAWNRRPK